MINASTEWYAVYTRPRFEKKVSERLAANGFSHYCPLNKVVRQWHDRKKTILQPLFPSYVFVKIDKKDMWRVKETDGVVNFVHWLGKPAVIREVEITAIMDFLNDYSDVKVNQEQIRINDRIRINSGYLKGREAKVIFITDKQVKLEIPSLGMSLTAIVNTSDLSLIKN
ncbi:UpxY family transcription antiterminator [Pedobacter sp. N23S346]|uniref:UpxY family transcription antiterminator n=1 Tax=Pedobacter sp. N23S346 TaxID=3402750 RepID=UPI003AC45575